MDTDAIFEAVEKDHQLEDKVNGSTAELAEHRWHWTLDTSNPERVDFTTYAARVGRSIKAVSTMANGFNLTVKNDDLDIQEAIARASVSAERTEVIEAVIAATGKSFQNVVKNNAQLASSVQKAARERAEARGSTVSEELPRAAQSVVASQRATKKEKEERKQGKGKLHLAVEGHLVNAHLSLKYALRDSQGGELTDEEREFLAADVKRLRDLLNLLDLRISGSADIDWDSELAALGEQK